MAGPSYRVRSLRMPVSKFRLYMAVAAAVLFSVLLYFASVRFDWFNLSRAVYLLLGVAEGSLIGLYEAGFVTTELTKKTEATAWRILPISLLGLLPLLLIIMLYGTSELVPYGAYFIIPYMPAYYAASGWRYSKFEEKREVQIFTLYRFGFVFWSEPVNLGSRLNWFLGSVVSQDLSGILYQAAYAEDFIASVMGKPKIERPTKDFLSKLLETLRKYRRRSIAFVCVVCVSMLSLLVYTFVLVATNTFGLEEFVGGVMVNGPEIAVIFGIVPLVLFIGTIVIAGFLLKRRYQKRISSLLASLRPSTTSNLKILMEPES